MCTLFWIYELVSVSIPGSAIGSTLPGSAPVDLLLDRHHPFSLQDPSCIIIIYVCPSYNS